MVHDLHYVSLRGEELTAYYGRLLRKASAMKHAATRCGSARPACLHGGTAYY